MKITKMGNLTHRHNYYERIGDKDLYWLAGLLEGEGSFNLNRASPRIAIKMTDQDIIERVADLFDVKYHKIRVPQDNRKDYYSTFIRGIHAVHMMVRLYTLLGERRKRQINKTINAWKGNEINHKLTREQAQEIYERAHGNESQKEISEDYNISRATVKDIKLGYTWSHTTGA